MTPTSAKGQKIYFVLPAYNEEDTITDVVREWHAVAEQCGTGSRVLVANDGSTDATAAILRNLEAEMPLLKVIDKPNSGHGPTLTVLYRQALAEGADLVFQTDSDGQTLPEEFDRMLSSIADADMVIGHRRQRADGFARWCVTTMLRLTVWVLMGTRLTDSNCPYRLMRRDALNRVIADIPDDFFLTNVAVAALAKRRKMRIAWPEVTFRERQGGTASINLRRVFGIGCRAIRQMIKLRRTSKA